MIEHTSRVQGGDQKQADSGVRPVYERALRRVVL